VLPRTRVALSAAVAIAVAGASVNAVSAAPRANATNVVRAMPTLADRILEHINADRARYGLGRLHLSPRLRAAAGFHSNEMAHDGFFSHVSLDGTSPWARVARFYRSAGYRHWAVGETMDWSSGGTDAAGIVADWMRSPDHRRILLDRSFREIGIVAVHASAASGSFQGSAVTLVTADFGSRAR
jgi:uncharacterized protein YkwD